jgi:hypothetical protein
MAVGIDRAGIGHRHVSEQKNGFHVRRVGEPVGANRAADIFRTIVAPDVVANHAPALAHEILFQPLQLRAERAGHGAIDDQDDFAARLRERCVQPDREVTPRRVERGFLFDLVFVDAAERDVVVGE